MQGIYIHDLGLNFVKTCFTNYWGYLCFFGIYIFIVIFMFLSIKKEHKMLSIYNLFLFATIFNPALIKYFFAPFQMDDVYYRFIWLLPVNILLAYLGTQCIDLGTTAFQKAFVGICIVGTIMLVGSPVKYWKSAVNFPDNLYKVSDDVLEVSEYIHQDTTEENPRIAVAQELIMSMRQYDASLILTLDRDMVLCWQGAPNFQVLSDNEWYVYEKSIMDVIYGGNTSNPDDFRTAIQATSTQYLVYSCQLDIATFLTAEGFTPIAQTDNFVIFRNNM